MNKHDFKNDIARLIKESDLVEITKDNILAEIEILAEAMIRDDMGLFQIKKNNYPLLNENGLLYDFENELAYDDKLVFGLNDTKLLDYSFGNTFWDYDDYLKTTFDATKITDIILCEYNEVEQYSKTYNKLFDYLYKDIEKEINNLNDDLEKQLKKSVEYYENMKHYVEMEYENEK